MADAANQEIEANAGLPIDDTEDGGFAEFEDIKKALASETGEDSDDSEELPVESSDDLFAAFGESEDIDSANLEAEEATREAVEEKPTRANRRIQKLAKERKALEEQMVQRDAYYQQQIAHLQQQVQQGGASGNEALQQQIDLQRKHLELLTTQRVSEEEANLSPMESYKRNILKEAGASARGELGKELEALRAEVQGEKTARQQQKEDSDRQARYAFYTKQTQNARNAVLLNGFSKEAGSSLANEADEMILAYAGAFGLEPKDAAVRLRKWADNYARGMLNARAKGGGQKIKKGRSVPKSNAGGRRAVQGNSWPKMTELRKAGFDSHLDWVAAGEPPVG